MRWPSLNALEIDVDLLYPCSMFIDLFTSTTACTAGTRKDVVHPIGVHISGQVHAWRRHGWRRHGYLRPESMADVRCGGGWGTSRSEMKPDAYAAAPPHPGRSSPPA